MPANAAGRLAQDDQRGAGVDHEVDKPPFDPRLDLEMALTVAFQDQAAPGGARLTQFASRFNDGDLRLGPCFDRTVGKSGRIAAGDDQGGGKENELTHGKAQ